MVVERLAGLPQRGDHAAFDAAHDQRRVESGMPREQGINARIRLVNVTGHQMGPDPAADGSQYRFTRGDGGPLDDQGAQPGQIV